MNTNRRVVITGLGAVSDIGATATSMWASMKSGRSGIGPITAFEQDDQILNGIFERARELSDDPLHAYLIGLKMFAETMGEMDEAHPGCMVATVTYHDKQFNDEIRTMNREGMIRWRGLFLSFLEDIVQTYPPRAEVDVEVLADMLSSTVEGGIILSKVFNDPKALANQILQYRTFIRLLFLGN